MVTEDVAFVSRGPVVHPDRERIRDLEFHSHLVCTGQRNPLVLALPDGWRNPRWRSFCSPTLSVDHRTDFSFPPGKRSPVPSCAGRGGVGWAGRLSCKGLAEGETGREKIKQRLNLNSRGNLRPRGSRKERIKQPAK